MPDLIWAAACIFCSSVAALVGFFVGRSNSQLEPFLKATLNGTSYVVPLSQIGLVIEDIRELEPSDVFTVQIVYLSAKDYVAMPDFEGF
jgi:hypothetical protein